MTSLAPSVQRMTPELRAIWEIESRLDFAVEAAVGGEADGVQLFALGALGRSVLQAEAMDNAFVSDYIDCVEINHGDVIRWAINAATL